MELFIHMGLGKTGTTFLQERVFSRHSAINYLGKTEDKFPDWLIDWHYWDDYAFIKNNYIIKEKLNSLLCSYKVNLISSEPFTGLGGMFYKQAHRIKHIAPKAKIIIVLRDPIEIILSFYKFNVERENWFLALEEVIDWKRAPLVFYKRKPIYLPDLFFDEIIEVYETLFGKEKICILKYEDMVNAPKVFFEELSEFVGVSFNLSEVDVVKKINKSVDEKAIPLIRAQNIHKHIQNICPSISEKITVNEILKNINDEIISEELKIRLQNYFKGKSCYY